MRKQTVFTPEGMSYSPSTVQVKLEETDPYNTIYYIYAEGSSHSTQVYFVRGDLMSRDGESNLTYYVNSALNGKTISRDMVVILCYLMGNISSDNTNPLEVVYHSTGPYNP